jgi:UDP-N-acetylglucosamine--N-acetylmuramyl-(pentapeptide) pyrophosphoryl-undecaprenol N-acetylglucosamine transferase
MPGIAVARELARRHSGVRILFVGSDRGIERRVVPAEGFELKTLRVGGFKRTGWRSRAGNLVALISALIRSARIVWGFHPDVVIGLGGYASFPVMAVATLFRVPRLVMEQNVFPGLANRIVGRFATLVAVPDQEAAAHFPGRTVVTGNPVRPEFKGIAPVSPGDRIDVLVTGGSQGAAPINRAVIDALPHLAGLRDRLRFVHQTGERQMREIEGAYASGGFDAEVASFFEDFAREYARADLVVCRAGATTVAEIRAALFIPLEFAADDHQRKNARAMLVQDAAVMIDPTELSGPRLAAEIAALVGNPARIEELGRHARRMAVPDSESKIADLVEQISRR